MRRLVFLGAFAILLQAATVQADAAAGRSTHYRVARRISGPDGRWDLAVVDSTTQRLYVGKEGGIIVINVSDGTLLPKFFASPVVHQVLPLDDGRLIATTGLSNKAVVLDGTTGQVVAEVPTGDDPDGVAYDRKTGLAITFNRGGLDATIFDVAKARVTGGFKLPGKPESAVADDDGRVYVNIASQNEIAVVDMLKGRITNVLPLKGCKEPTGLALDKKGGLLIAACSNGIAKVMTTGGRKLADLKVGREPDAAFVDARRKLAFVPAGGDGTLAVISFADRNNIRVVQRLATQLGTRTGAVDSQTGIVYLPTAKLLPPAPPAKWPSVVPGSFEIMVVEPDGVGAPAGARPLE